MDYIRIQDKVISWFKLEKKIRKILQLRTQGYTQQEVAERLLLDRSFVSRLEKIGELRKGQTIACIGFPLLNKGEIQEILETEGVDFIFLMNETERLQFINEISGKDLLNTLMNLITQLKDYDTLICIGSDARIKIVEGILDNQVVSIEIGKSPISEDKWLDPYILKEVLSHIKSAK